MRGTMKLLVTTLATLMLLFHVSPAHALDYDQCLSVVRSKEWQVKNGTSGGTTNWGEPIPLDANTTSITYDLCVRACADPGHGTFKWSVFSSQCSAWLLPWFHLAFQLPSGSGGLWDDLVCIVLVVGSPALAAYSLAFTIFNGHWLSSRLHSKASRHRNTDDAIRVLQILQRYPVRVNPDLLPSLAENDQWWRHLSGRVAESGTWSLPAASNVALVVVAYIFSVINSLTGDFVRYVNADGQAVGSVWLWLLGIVIGWLQISTKNDFEEDVQVANDKYLSRDPKDAEDNGDHVPDLASQDLESATQGSASQAGEYPISIISDLDNLEAYRPAPTFNYIRVLSWVEVADDVITALEHGQPANRRVGISLSTWCRMLGASMVALFLLWGTVGAAAMIVYLTPTIGIGCRCFTYFLYGGIATIVWLVFVISSILHRYAEVAPSCSASQKILEALSVFLRRLGKILAAANTVVLITVCVFQFTGVYDSCRCVGSLIGLGRDKSYVVLEMSPLEVRQLKTAWTGGFLLAICTVGLFTAMTSIFKLTEHRRLQCTSSN